MGARHGGNRPRKTPAVAMKHRQRPQINWVVRKLPIDNIAHRIEIGAAMVIDHAFRVSGGARGVVQGDRVPFVIRQMPFEIAVTLRKKIFIFKFAKGFTTSEGRVININDQRFYFYQRERLFDHCRKFAIRKQHLRLTVIKHEGDGLSIKPRVQRIEHRTQHARRVM